MPTITINGTPCDFTPGQTVLQVASAHDIDIPHYCFHEGLSIVASCRICLAEVWAPNPRNDNKIEPIPKLLPTCQIQAQDGQFVYTDSPRAAANQKAVMEYLLVNHPLDCPVCDQAGECKLQDYSYDHGRGVSRFQEQKIKQSKKDVGPNVLLYSDRCIMCTRCVRFTREVTGTNELIVNGRGSTEQIDTFPGKALDNALASNVIDLCPVGALLDKDFLFKKRVWELTSSPSIDGVTSSGDNLWIDHADGEIYRLRPRTNLDVNLWWITDEVRYGWKHIHADERLTEPRRRRNGALVPTEYPRAVNEAVAGIERATQAGKKLAALVAPNLPCEEAYAISQTARRFDENAILGVGPIPIVGEDQSFPPDHADEEPIHQSPRSFKTTGDKRKFILRAEKCPNSRGVRRVLENVEGAKTGETSAGNTGAGGTGVSPVNDFAQFIDKLKDPAVAAVILTGNYPSDWSTPQLCAALSRPDLFVILLDTLASPLVDLADVVIPAATWAEKAGAFENAEGRLQAFDRAIQPIAGATPEGQIALDLQSEIENRRKASAADRTRTIYDAAQIRQEMANASAALARFTTDVHEPPAPSLRIADMQVVEV